MPYNSTVYRILIASPSDVAEEREIATRLIQNWNDLNSFAKKIVLLPIRWEFHSTPTYDVRPQEAINKQIVDSVDLVIGLFWSKIGTHTGLEPSGTIEEIKRAASNGKDVMIYFSKRGIDPSEIDLEQLKSLKEFKEDVYQNALVESFNSVVDFRDKLSRQLEHQVRKLQNSNTETKTNLKFSFINKKTNLLEAKNIVAEIDRIVITNKEIENILSELQDKFSNIYGYKKKLLDYVEKVNTIPLVLGILNEDSVVYNDLNVDLELSVNVSNSIYVNVIGSPDSNNFQKQLESGKLMIDDEINILSLYEDAIQRKDSKTMTIETESLIIMPNKIKCIKPLILLSASKDVVVTLDANIHSNSLLSSISESLTIQIKVNKRKIKQIEIDDIFIKHKLNLDDIFD